MIFDYIKHLYEGYKMFTYRYSSELMQMIVPLLYNYLYMLLNHIINDTKKNSYDKSLRDVLNIRVKLVKVKPYQE